MTILIRRCTLEDLADLQSLAYQTYDETFRPANEPENIDAYLKAAFETSRLEGELLDPNSSFYFLYKDGTLSGYLKLNEKEAQTDFRDEDWLEIERIYVKQEFQGLGLGKLLIAKGLEIAREKEKPAVWLGVWEKNEKAIAFYTRMGFRRVGTHDFYLGSDRQTDYLMKLDLMDQAATQSGENL